MNINSKDAKYFEDSYLNLYYSDSSGKLMKKGHQLMENFNFDKHDDILEVGAGFMPHISFLKNKFKNYYAIDIHTAFKASDFYRDNFPEIKFDYYDGKKIPFNDNTFDRIISSHCIEHIPDPENHLLELTRVLKNNGIITFALPCDPGLLYRFGRFIWKKTVLKKNPHPLPDYDHDYFAAKEHINSIFNLYAIIKKKNQYCK